MQKFVHEKIFDAQKLPSLKISLFQYSKTKNLLSLSTLTASTCAFSPAWMRRGVRWKQSGTLGVLVPLTTVSSSLRRMRQSWSRADRSSFPDPDGPCSGSLAGNLTAAYAPSTCGKNTRGKYNIKTYNIEDALSFSCVQMANCPEGWLPLG